MDKRNPVTDPEGVHQFALAVSLEAKHLSLLRSFAIKHLKVAV